MLMATVFDRFVNESPLTVMARSLMENALDSTRIDEIFEQNAISQYTDTLLFSTVVDAMGMIVTGFYDSLHAIKVRLPDFFPVDIKNVYAKVKGIELPVMQELVRDNAARLTEVINALGCAKPPLLPGFPVKILDGNCLAGSQHRIKALRGIGSSPLPGKTLNVYDPQLGLVVDVFPCEDGHAQERSMLGPVLERVQAGELWIEDRNFCTVGWLCGVILHRKAHVLVREHKGLPWTAQEEPRLIGRVETGEVWEQKVVVKSESGEVLNLRRIILKLDTPTRDGETELALLTDLSSEQANALVLARLYLERWQIETVFNVLTETLQCEHPRLGYPKAALFAFCVTLVAYNILAVIKGALGVVHGREKVEKEVSLFHVTQEIKRTHAGMMIAIPVREWLKFRTLNATEMAQTLRELASHVDLALFKKAPTKPKKPKIPRQYDPKHPHVSTAKVLAESRCR